MNTNPEVPRRGEVWLVSLDPALGSEIRKTRPAIIIQRDDVGKLPVKLVVPVTGWKPYFSKNNWQVKLKPTAQNGLSKLSTADTLQMRGVSLQRFSRKLGYVSDTTLSKIAITIAAMVQASL